MNRQSNTYNLFRHPLIIWIVVWLIYFAIYLQFSLALSIVKSTLTTLSQLLVFYTVQSVFIPRYFEQKLGKFVLFTLIFILIITGISSFLERLCAALVISLHENNSPGILAVFMEFILISIALWVSVSVYIFRKDRKTRKKLEDLKSEKANSELKYLKAQISPHFLFNALNNIYTIAYIGDKSAPDKIAMLSGMLRYVIYDCSSDYVPLEKELGYMTNYIAFQQLKTEKEQKIKTDIQVENRNTRIAPMMLIPFVENAFKHSRIILDRKGFVELKLNQQGHDLTFSVRNSIPSYKTETNSSNSGIGIENLKNRLELIYKNNFSLRIRESEDEYYMVLNLRLQ